MHSSSMLRSYDWMPALLQEHYAIRSTMYAKREDQMGVTIEAGGILLCIWLLFSEVY